jgi:uncharacterized protein (DUF2147 family)
MKTLFIFLGLFLTSVSMKAQQSINGIWNTGQDNTKIEVKSENGIYNGKIISSDNSNVKKGTLILKEVKSESGKWKGKLYSLKKKEWFDAVLELKGSKLMVTVKSGWASKTVEWTKS